MSLIIAATDFSSVGHNAVTYACELASAYKASLTIVHSYNVPVTFAENPMPVLPIEESRQIAQKSLDDLTAKLATTYPGVSINTHLSFGDITEGISEYTEYNAPWLVVVGNSLSDEDNFWFGSNLLHLMRELKYPVLAVPHNASFNPVKNICLACDYKRVADHLPYKDIVNLVNITGASLQVLNIDHDNKTFGIDTPLESSVLHEELAAVKPTFHYADNEDVEDGINEFVKANGADWLVVTPHKHGFIEGLFHRSRTKAIAKHIHIPVLALHEV